MSKVLVCWIGNADLKASQGNGKGIGPVANAVTKRSFDDVRLLASHSKEEANKFVEWLKTRTNASVGVDYYPYLKNNPTDFDKIFKACRTTLKSIREDYSDGLKLTFHFSPGTSQMAATWLILSETEYPARLIQSSPEQGVKDIDLPVSLWTDSYIKIKGEIEIRDAILEGNASEMPPESAHFENILHRSEVMRETIVRARKVAPRTIPVLIEGESGTGKELFARAIHESSLCCKGPFIPVNCGALPKDLIESELFGHVKGAYTGAGTSEKGKFEQANGGTLFLDELGELPPAAQVTLLRVLDEKKVWPVGSTQSRPLDVRIIAATNRSLMQEVKDGRFREDLFYRLAVAMLKLPALRRRGVDIKFLIHWLLDQVNEESKKELQYQSKKISPRGIKLMLLHPWPGNVRELKNTLRRLCVWSDSVVISEEEVKEALFTELSPSKNKEDIMQRDVTQNFVLQDILDEVEEHYIRKAYQESGKRKKEATKLLGMSNYQTLTKRMDKYGVN